MLKKVFIQQKEEASSGFGPNNKPWTRYKYTTDQGVYYMLDELAVGKECEIESYIYTGKDGKEHTSWRLPKKKATSENNDKLDDVLKYVKWLVRNEMKKSKEGLYNQKTEAVDPIVESPVKDEDVPF